MYFIQVRDAMTCVPNKHRAHLLRETNTNHASVVFVGYCL